MTCPRIAINIIDTTSLSLNILDVTMYKDDDDNVDLTRTPCTKIWWEQCRMKRTDDNLLKIVVDPLKYNQDKPADVHSVFVSRRPFYDTDTLTFQKSSFSIAI